MKLELILFIILTALQGFVAGVCFEAREYSRLVVILITIAAVYLYLLPMIMRLP